MSSHTAGLRALSRARKVRFLDSAIELGSIVFGTVMVTDASGGVQTYYRFIILGILFLLAWFRARLQEQPPRPPYQTAFFDVSVLSCLGIIEFVFSILTDSGDSALANWTVSIMLAIATILLAHYIRHPQDKKACRVLFFILEALTVAVVFVVVMTSKALGLAL